MTISSPGSASIRPEFIACVERDERGVLARDAFCEDSPGLLLDGDLAAGTWVRVFTRDGRVLRYSLMATPGSAAAELLVLAQRRGLDPVLPAEVEAEAAALAREPGTDDPALVDLRDLAFCTIDYVRSKDLDQALFVEREPGGFVVWYAIADAAYYVRPGTAIFDEALRRGATYYLPGLMVPMLPQALCEGVVSLNPRVDRRALVFCIRVGRDGRCRQTKIMRGRIHSRAKLSYSQVQDFLDGLGPLVDCEGAAVDDEGVVAAMGLLAEVGEARLREAESRNVVRFNRSEVNVSIAGNPGLRFVAITAQRKDVERYNEQISLLANIEGARFLVEEDKAQEHVQPIFRFHEPPDDARLLSLQQQIGEILKGQELPADSWSWRLDGSMSLANYLRQLPADRRHEGVVKSIQRQAMMATGRSGYSPDPDRHHGVGSDVYARFTAPMREMVGVFVHRETWQKLSGRADEVPAGVPDDEVLRTRVIKAANRAKKIQRDLNREANRLVLDQLFETDMRLPMEERPARSGIVMGIGRGKIYLQFDDPAIDVKLYQGDLEQELGRPLQGSKDQAMLLDEGRPWLRVGDRVRVRVKGSDAERDRWVLVLVDPGSDASP